MDDSCFVPRTPPPEYEDIKSKEAATSDECTQNERVYSAHQGLVDYNLTKKLPV